jgi:radical SAM protein with 4Fe4S-binding SPASM domain
MSIESMEWLRLLKLETVGIAGKYSILDLNRRLFNIPMRRIDARFLPLRTLSMPYKAQIEPTNKCNLSCQMCHRSIMPLSSIGEMKFANFKKIVDPLLPYLQTVWLQGEGEPFLCKDIFKMIAYLKRKDVYVNTVTNATLLEETMTRAILSSGLDEIAFSIDGATARTYEQIRVGAHFKEVTENIRNFASTLENSSQKKPKLCAFVVAMKENLQELPDIVTLVHNLGLKYLWVQDVQFQQLNAGFATEEESLRVLATKDDLERQRIEHYVKKALALTHKYNLQIIRYGGKSVFDRLAITYSRQKCTWPWTNTYITWDGLVSPCCIPSTYICGNLFQESFRMIWNNKKYQHFRNGLKTGEMPYQCVNCSFL